MTSAVSASDRKASRPSEVLRSSIMLFFPRCVLRNQTLSPPARYPRFRTGSPWLGSILMTSAPWSAISSVRCGPGRNCDRSRTRIPSSFMSYRPVRTQHFDLVLSHAAFRKQRLGIEAERRGWPPVGPLAIDPDRTCDHPEVALLRVGEPENAAGRMKIRVVDRLL